MIRYAMMMALPSLVVSIVTDVRKKSWNHPPREHLSNFLTFSSFCCLCSQVIGSPLEKPVELSDDKITLTLERRLYVGPNNLKQWMYSINGEVIGPTLRVRAGEVFELKFQNKLESKGFETYHHGKNGMKAFDSTNIHLHGLHLSGILPQDAVLIQIPPGDTRTYLYTIPISHEGGTFLYHPRETPSIDLTRAVALHEPSVSHASCHLAQTCMAPLVYKLEAARRGS